MTQAEMDGLDLESLSPIAIKAVIKALADLCGADNVNCQRDLMRYMGLFDAGRAALLWCGISRLRGDGNPEYRPFLPPSRLSMPAEFYLEEARRAFERVQREWERFYWEVTPEVEHRPKIVCLCGSTRFWRTFQQASLEETLAGRIVLSIGAASGTDDEHFGNLPREDYDAVKAQLDELHLRKIDMADEVLILNVGGYIGESTARELDYARTVGKHVRFLEEVPS